MDWSTRMVRIHRVSTTDKMPINLLNMELFKSHRLDQMSSDIKVTDNKSPVTQEN